MNSFQKHLHSQNQEATAKPVLRIAFTGDVICPWSYMGWHRLETALARVHAPVEFNFRPFPLFPALPEEGADFESFLASSFGDVKVIKDMLNQLQLSALKEGLNLHLNRVHRLPNPHKAHLLLVWASEKGKQIPLLEALYKAFFEEGLDIGNSDILKAIAQLVDIRPEDVDQALAEPRLEKILKADMAMTSHQGLDSMPEMLINNRWKINGVESVDTLLDTFDQALFPSEENGRTHSSVLH